MTPLNRSKEHLDDTDLAVALRPMPTYFESFTDVPAMLIPITWRDCKTPLRERLQPVYVTHFTTRDLDGPSTFEQAAHTLNNLLRGVPCGRVSQVRAELGLFSEAWIAERLSEVVHSLRVMGYKAQGSGLHGFTLEGETELLGQRLHYRCRPEYDCDPFPRSLLDRSILEGVARIGQQRVHWIVTSPCESSTYGLRLTVDNCNTQGLAAEIETRLRSELYIMNPQESFGLDINWVK